MSTLLTKGEKAVLDILIDTASENNGKVFAVPTPAAIVAAAATMTVGAAVAATIGDRTDVSEYSEEELAELFKKIKKEINLDNVSLEQLIELRNRLG